MELPSIGVEPPNVDGEALREYWLREECRVEVVFFFKWAWCLSMADLGF